MTSTTYSRFPIDDDDADCVNHEYDRVSRVHKYYYISKISFPSIE